MTPSTAPVCTYVREGALATITLDRPDARNAMNLPLLEQLVAALEQARIDQVTVTVLAATGPAFCAGADVRADDGTQRGRPGLRRELIEQALDLVEALPMTVAAVQGAAVGGGWALALATDFCLADPSAVFRFPELPLGFLPPVSTVRRLCASIGTHASVRALALGRPYTAGQLEALGLVQVVPPGELATATAAVTDLLAAQDRGLLTSLTALIRDLDGKGNR
jgi:enoyl-CoA hydratase/carnithine racemase